MNPVIRFKGSFPGPCAVLVCDLFLEDHQLAAAAKVPLAINEYIHRCICRYRCIDIDIDIDIDVDEDVYT